MKDYFEYKGYRGSREFSSEDKCLYGKVMFIDSLLMYDGNTYQELEKAFRETIDSYLALCKRRGDKPNKSYGGSFNVRLTPELHQKAAMKAAINNQSLNQFCFSAIEAAVERTFDASDMAQVYGSARDIFSHQKIGNVIQGTMEYVRMVEDQPLMTDAVFDAMANQYHHVGR